MQRKGLHKMVHLVVSYKLKPPICCDFYRANNTPHAPPPPPPPWTSGWHLPLGLKVIFIPILVHKCGIYIFARRKCSVVSYSLHMLHWSLVTVSFEFFTVCTKLAEMAILYSKDLTTAKKVTSSRARPGARDYCWIRSPMPNHMS